MNFFLWWMSREEFFKVGKWGIKVIIVGYERKRLKSGERVW